MEKVNELYGVAVVPLIIAMVQVAKSLGLPRKYAALVAWGLGLAVGFGVFKTAYLEAIIVGSALGLSAAGLYSVGRIPNKSS